MMNKQSTAKTLTLTVNGRTTEDLVDALQNILREVEDGYLEGFDSNYTGDYHYRINEKSAANPVLEELAA